MNKIKIKVFDLKNQYTQIKSEISDAINNVLDSGEYVNSQLIRDFEEKYADFTGSEHCVATSNGTDAIYIALRAAGVGHDDEVITVANSYIATSEAITMTGAIPVFVDCEYGSHLINSKLIEKAISKKTKAIVPVHLYGQPADMEEICEIAQRNNLFVIEDCAHAHGARYKGQHVGNFGIAGCFSFYPGKNLGAYGDAGGIVCNDDEYEKTVRMLVNHGKISSRSDHIIEGTNSRMDSIQAAILLVKLKYLKDWIKLRQDIADIYYLNLPLNSELISLPVYKLFREHSYHLFVVRVSSRDHVIKKLISYGIQTNIHYPKIIPEQTAYNHMKFQFEFPAASKLSNLVLTLPLYPELEKSEVLFVCEKLLSCIETL